MRMDFDADLRCQCSGMMREEEEEEERRRRTPDRPRMRKEGQKDGGA